MDTRLFGKYWHSIGQAGCIDIESTLLVIFLLCPGSHGPVFVYARSIPIAMSYGRQFNTLRPKRNARNITDDFKK